MFGLVIWILNFQVYALTKERDMLRREQSRKNDSSILLKEKDEIIKQVMAEGKSCATFIQLTMQKLYVNRDKPCCAREDPGCSCEIYKHTVPVYTLVLNVLRSVGEELSKKQAVLEGTVKKLRAQVCGQSIRGFLIHVHNGSSWTFVINSRRRFASKRG